MGVVNLSPNKDALETAKDLLRHEAKALAHLADHLDASFSDAMALLMATKGRVIVTGMGKSGHIGAKIAATLASTGTPSLFVHPAEASHGDLGMITANDVVIALSHSGEAPELGDILAYCQRLGVPIIAITGKNESTLGKSGTVVLNTLVTEEACPIQKAPTTSSTATLAMGDALAVALMGQRGFKAEDFANFHPGGKLGGQLKKVSDLMAKGDDLPLVDARATMDQVILEMTNKNLGGVGIVKDDGTLAGIITDGDLKRVMNPDVLSSKATDVMNATPLTIEADMFAVRAVQTMQEKQITAFFVVDKSNKPVGLLHIHHCLQAGVL